LPGEGKPKKTQKTKMKCPTDGPTKNLEKKRPRTQKCGQKKKGGVTILRLGKHKSHKGRAHEKKNGGEIAEPDEETRANGHQRSERRRKGRVSKLVKELGKGGRNA